MDSLYLILLALFLLVSINKSAEIKKPPQAYKLAAAWRRKRNLNTRICVNCSKPMYESR